MVGPFIVHVVANDDFMIFAIYAFNGSKERVLGKFCDVWKVGLLFFTKNLSQINAVVEDV
ncbi:hypothetical protein SB5_20790 [Pseudomonas oryzihabitans]|nr:hypothetical protein SB5_20790 [Pseudomonas psychrotolerans]